MTPSVAHILGGDPPRVWSFIVTIFGDLAREDDRYISSRTLNRLTAEIGEYRKSLSIYSVSQGVEIVHVWL